MIESMRKRKPRTDRVWVSRTQNKQELNRDLCEQRLMGKQKPASHECVGKGQTNSGCGW